MSDEIGTHSTRVESSLPGADVRPMDRYEAKAKTDTIKRDLGHVYRPD